MTVYERLHDMTSAQMETFLSALYTKAQQDCAYGLDDSDILNANFMNQDACQLDCMLDTNYFAFIESCLDDVGYCYIKMTIPDFNKLISKYGKRITYDGLSYRLKEDENENI